MGRHNVLEDWEAGVLNRLEKTIRQRPGITGRELAQAHNSLEGDQRAYFLEQLIADGKITTTKENTKGRPRLRYWPVSECQQKAARASQLARQTTFPVPPENERELVLSWLRDSEPARVDWAALRLIADAAYA